MFLFGLLMSIARSPWPLYKLIEDDSSAPLRKLNHLLPLWFWETDADYVISYCSDNIGRLTGVEADDLVGVCILNPLYGRSESEAGLAGYHDALRRREPIESFSYERILLSGEKAVLLDSAIPQFGDAGEFRGYCGISFHLSEALRAADDNGSLMVSLQNRAERLEEALSQRNADLAASNRLLAEVLDALGEGLLVTSRSNLADPENKVLFVNPAYRAMFGFGEHEVYPGVSIVELRNILLQRGDTLEHPLTDADDRMRQGETLSLDIPSVGISLEVKGIPRSDGGMVLVHTDVTALKAQVAMLERAKRDAEAANTAKSSFLAAMSHEIRTPMNGIIGVADLLHDTALTAEQLEFVDTIRSSAIALTSLISDILDFSKIEAGHLALFEADFDVGDLVDEMHRMMSPMTQAKGIELAIHVAPDHPRHVTGDLQRLRQVLINLLGNAIKFTLEGRVSLSVSREDGATSCIEVCDTGVGIPAQNLDGIFNSFEQVQTGLRREFEGTGLGLSISKELVEAMGGSICVASQEGAWSKFTMRLPLPASENAPLAEPDQHAQNLERSDFTGCSVLLAEDNQTNQFVAKKMLERFGIEPQIVLNGLQACEAFEAGMFDLVLMDVSMPVLSGLDATQRIRAFEQSQKRKRCPIIALTGNALESDRQDCLGAGMDGFMTKPVRLQDLAGWLDTVLGANGGALPPS